MSSSVHVDNKKEDIFNLDKGPTQIYFLKVIQNLLQKKI